MTTKTKTNCSVCQNAPYLWFDEGEWIIDTDDGMRGYKANFCPNCGNELSLSPDASTPNGVSVLAEGETP